MNQNFFVGIGAQRAGTTWLGNYLLNHPQVGFSPLKELHYFDAVYRKDMCGSFNKRMAKNLKKQVSKIKSKGIPSCQELEKIRCLALRLEMLSNEDYYKKYFDLIAQEQHNIVGEITPSYSMLDKTGFAAIKHLYKNAKILFIMRDPVDRYWSHVKFSKTHFGLDKYDAIGSGLDYLSDPRYVLRTNYKRTLIELYKVFPRENVFIAFYENLMDPATHEAELKKIHRFFRY